MRNTLNEQKLKQKSEKRSSKALGMFADAALAGRNEQSLPLISQSLAAIYP